MSRGRRQERYARETARMTRQQVQLAREQALSQQAWQAEQQHQWRYVNDPAYRAWADANPQVVAQAAAAHQQQLQAMQAQHRRRSFWAWMLGR